MQPYADRCRYMYVRLGLNYTRLYTYIHTYVCMYVGVTYVQTVVSATLTSIDTVHGRVEVIIGASHGHIDRLDLPRVRIASSSVIRGASRCPLCKYMYMHACSPLLAHLLVWERSTALRKRREKELSE